MDMTYIAVTSGLILGAAITFAWAVKYIVGRPRKHRRVSLDELLHPPPPLRAVPNPTAPRWDGSSRRLWAGKEWDQFASDPRDLLDQ